MYSTTSIAPGHSESHSRSVNLGWILTFAGIIAIPLLLSFFFFMHQSLRLDESQSLWQTSRSVGDTITMVAGDVHVPLYHILLHYWRIVVGDSVPAARFLSLLFYVVSIPTLYLLGTRAYNKKTALFATFLFAISPFMNWYGNETRMYTLFTLFVILNQYCFLRIMQQDDSDHVWSGYVGTALLGLFTHYFFLLNLASQAAFYFMRRDLFPTYALRRFLFTAGLLLVAFLPWAWYVTHVGTAGFESPVLATPSTVNLFSSFSQFLFGFQDDNINTFFLSLWPVSVAIGLFSLRRSAMRPQTEYFIVTVLLSMLLPFFVSIVYKPVFVTRYLIFTIPSLYLLLASVLNNYSPQTQRWARGILSAVMIAMLFIEIFNPTTPVHENYAQAAEYLNARASPSDVVVLSAPFTIYPVEYYYRGPAPVRTLPTWNQYQYGAIPAFDAAQLPAQVGTVTDASQNVYLLLSYDQGYEQSIKQYFDSHYQRIDMQNFSHDLNLYVYKLRYDTGQPVFLPNHSSTPASPAAAATSTTQSTTSTVTSEASSTASTTTVTTTGTSTDK